MSFSIDHLFALLGKLNDLGLELGRVWQHIKRILKKKEFCYFIDTLTGDMYWALFYMHMILKTMRQVKLQSPKSNGMYTLVWWPQDNGIETLPDHDISKSNAWNVVDETEEQNKGSRAEVHVCR